MSGNVWEWCQTKWTNDYKNYTKTEDNDPEGDSSRVVRGGSFHDDGSGVRCACRDGYVPGDYDRLQGVRVVLSPIRL